MRIAWDDQVSKKRWTSILRSSGHAYFFHTPEWAEILQQTFGHTIATRIYEVDGAEVLIPMVEKRTAPFRAYASVPTAMAGYSGPKTSRPTPSPGSSGAWSAVGRSASPCTSRRGRRSR